MVGLWIVFALAFAFFHALLTIFDKIVLKNKRIEPMTFSTLRYGMNTLFALVIILLFFDFTALSLDVLPNVILLSIIYFGAGIFYFIPLKLGDVSQLIPFREVTTILLSFILAVILLSEVVSAFDLLGTLAIIIGGYILLTDGKIIIPKLSKALMFIAIGGFFLAVFGVFSKPVTSAIHPALLNFYMYILVFLIFLVINSSTNYKNQVNTFRVILNDKKILALSIGASLSAAIGTLSLFYGLTMGQAAEVLPISRLLPVFTVLMGWFALKEKSGLLRLVGAIITLAGVYLIAI